MSNNSNDAPPRRNQEFWDRVYRSRPSHHNGQRPVPTSTTTVRGDPWQSVSALQLGLQPRSFEELHKERMYLLEMLQQHDRRAVDLFGLVPAVEEQMQRPGVLPDEQRRARKSRGWLRHRIVDTVEEEKKILARLSELHVEIQCRERWHKVEREREVRMGSGGGGAVGEPQLQGQPLNTDYNGPVLPYQIPPPPYYPPIHILPPPYYQYYENPLTQGVYPEHYWAYQASTYPHDVPRNHGEPGPLEVVSTPIGGTLGSMSRSRSGSLEIITEQKPTKRNSMPTLNRTWSDGDRGRDGDT